MWAFVVPPFFLKLVGWWVCRATGSHSALALKHPSIYCPPLNASAMVRPRAKYLLPFLSCVFFLYLDPFLVWRNLFAMLCGLNMSHDQRVLSPLQVAPGHAQRRSAQETENCTHTRGSPAAIQEDVNAIRHAVFTALVHVPLRTGDAG